MTTDHGPRTTESETKPGIAIVGCGKVGTSLGRFLQKAGYPIVGLASRTLDSARKSAAVMETQRFTDAPETVTTGAGVVFITTPDDVIADACDALAEKGGFRPGTVVLHCSGALPSTLLARAQAAGAVVGSMHPLQSFARTEIDRNPFRGIVVSVEGQPEAVAAATAMARALEAHCVEIRTDAKTLYHASAVVASNYLVTVLGLAFDLLEKAGIGRADLYPILRPLVQGTLANIEKVGIPEALTGPVARGDVATVAAHLERIGALAPDRLALYSDLGRATVPLARARGLDDDSAQRLARLFDPPSAPTEK